MVKSKLPPRSGCSSEAVEPHPQEGVIKFFKFFLLILKFKHNYHILHLTLSKTIIIETYVYLEHCHT